MTVERPRPALVRLLAPPEVDTSTLVVALTNALRARGYRVGLATLGGGLAGGATVIVTGSGARITLPGTPTPEVLRARATALDPRLDLLLAEGDVDPGVPTIEVLAAEAPLTPRASLLGTVAAAQLLGAGPGEDCGLATVLEAHVLPHTAARSGLYEAAQAPIESQRRLLDRSEAPPAPPRRAASGWRRWLGR